MHVRALRIFALALVVIGLACTSKPARMTPLAGLVDLSVDLDPLRDQFEKDGDFPRAVLLLSPT